MGMESMSKLDPDGVTQIISMLQELLDQSEAREATLKQDLHQASENLNKTSNDLVNAQNNLASASTAHTNAESDLATQRGIEDDKRRELAEATQLKDDQFLPLNDERNVLLDVIQMLRTLLPSEGRRLLSLESEGLSILGKNPKKFISEMSKADPAAVQNIIDMLQELADGNQALINELWQNITNAEQALEDQQHLVVIYDDFYRTAIRDLNTAVREEGDAQDAVTAAQNAKAEAQGVYDGEIDTLNNEQQVLRDVIALLEGLLPSGGSGWSEYATDVACEGNGQGRDTACDVANGGGIECCQESALARGFQFVVWWSDQCYATTTCDDPYNLVDTVNYHHDGSSLISVTKVSSSPDAGSGNGRRLLSWKKKNHQKSSVTQIIKNPKKFIAEMSKADPDAVQNIIDMLEQLIADNENTVSAILQHVDDTAQALNAASAQVVADEDALGSAQGDEASAELAEASAETAKTEAQGVYDGEIDTLNNEQQVL